MYGGQEEDLGTSPESVSFIQAYIHIRFLWLCWIAVSTALDLPEDLLLMGLLLEVTYTFLE